MISVSVLSLLYVFIPHIYDFYIVFYVEVLR